MPFPKIWQFLLDSFSAPVEASGGLQGPAKELTVKALGFRNVRWGVYVTVGDVDATAKLAVEMGGKVLMPPARHPSSRTLLRPARPAGGHDQRHHLRVTGRVNKASPLRSGYARPRY